MQGFPFAPWLTLPCHGGRLLPSCWKQTPEGQVQPCSLALECVSCPREGNCGSRWGPCRQRRLMRCLDRHLQFHPWEAQGHIPFSSLLIPDPVQDSGHRSCRNWGGCSATRNLLCLSGRLLPESVCPKCGAHLQSVMADLECSHWERSCCICPSVQTVAAVALPRSCHRPARLSLWS